MSLLQIRPPAVQVRMVQMHVLFPVGHVHFAVLFVAAVAAVVVLLLVFKCVRLTGLDQTPVAPQRGQFVAAQDDEHEYDGHGEDSGGVEDVDEAFLVGEDGEGGTAGAQDQAADDDGDNVEGVGFVAADEDEEDDEREHQRAEAGPEVHVHQPPALLCYVDGLLEGFELVDGHLDSETGVDSVLDCVVNEDEVGGPVVRSVGRYICWRTDAGGVADALDVILDVVVVLVCIELLVEVVVVGELEQRIPQFDTIQVLLAYFLQVRRALCDVLEDVASHCDLLRALNHANNR